MNWKPISDDRARFKAAVQVQWVKLTDANLETIAGNRMALIASIRAAYKISQEQAEKQVDAWAKRSVAPASTP
jgi:uncharacterized protein YjbJ (UPF0337 family)